MRHVTVRHTALLLGGVFLAFAGVFSWLVRPQRGASPSVHAPHPGDALFRKYCASCHTVEDLRPSIASADAKRRAELERFLKRHGSSSDKEDGLILDYLAEKRAPSADTAR